VYTIVQNASKQVRRTPLLLGSRCCINIRRIVCHGDVHSGT
jgi:hypothetical protein